MFVQLPCCTWPSGPCRQHRCRHSPGEGSGELGAPACVDGKGKACEMAELSSFSLKLEMQKKEMKHRSDGWGWGVSCLTPLNFSFLICKMGTREVPTSQSVVKVLLR